MRELSSAQFEMTIGSKIMTNVCGQISIQVLGRSCLTGNLILTFLTFVGFPDFLYEEHLNSQLLL